MLEKYINDYCAKAKLSSLKVSHSELDVKNSGVIKIQTKQFPQHHNTLDGSVQKANLIDFVAFKELSKELIKPRPQTCVYPLQIPKNLRANSVCIPKRAASARPGTTNPRSSHLSERLLTR